MKWEFNCLNGAMGNEKTYLCVGHKIVDDTRLEKFNRMGEKNYQLIVEGLDTAVLFQDKKGELIAANQKMAEIFGTTLESLYQLKDIRSLWNSNLTITTEEGRQLLFDEAPFMKALKTGKTQNKIILIRLKSGEERWLGIGLSNIYERTRFYDGKVDIQTAPGKGCTVTVSIPFL